MLLGVFFALMSHSSSPPASEMRFDRRRSLFCSSVTGHRSYSQVISARDYFRELTQLADSVSLELAEDFSILLTVDRKTANICFHAPDLDLVISQHQNSSY